MTEEEVLNKLNEYAEFIISLRQENDALKNENKTLKEENESLKSKLNKPKRTRKKKVETPVVIEDSVSENIAEDTNTQFEQKSLPPEDTSEKEINPQVIPEEHNNKMIVKSAEKELTEMINNL